jgi:hypothetical protein
VQGEHIRAPDSDVLLNGSWQAADPFNGPASRDIVTNDDNDAYRETR